jgi:hypothetical protein
MADTTARLVHTSLAVLAIVCACAPAITQHLPFSNPPPDTPTRQGWAPHSSLALHNSPPRTTRCGLPRDAPPLPPLYPFTRTFQAADARAAFTHTHLRSTQNKDSQYRACAASSPVYAWRIIKRWWRRRRRWQQQPQQCVVSRGCADKIAKVV